MTQLALCSDSGPSVGAAVAAYVDATSTMFARTLATTTQALVEPIVAYPSAALRALGFLVESLTGVALGALAGSAVAGMRSWFGDAAARAVHRELARGWPAAAALATGPTPRYLADASARPLVDELGARLHVRLGRATADVRALAASMVAAASQPRTLVVMFDLLRADVAICSRLAEELAAGWLAYRAFVAGAPTPALASPRSRALWQAWSRQLANEPVTDAGAIMVIR